MDIENKQSSVIDLESLVNSHANPFVVIDKDYRILAINKAYELNYGSSSGDAVGRSCFQVSHGNEQPCDQEGETCPLKSVLETGKTCVCAHLHYDSEHRLHEVKVTAHPLRGSDGELYVGESIEAVDTPENRRAGGERMVGETPKFMACLNQLNVAASSDAPVLLQGETGTGKELAAEYIHNNSDRSNEPFQIVDSTVLTENLFESEMFGHERGSYTGNQGEKKGLFELAGGGTIFLDEIGDLPVSQQAKLLRVLESGQFRRVGGVKTLRCDVRIICATNRHLWESVQAGSFREDLYYRIACLNIRLPTLLERIDDVPPLARNLLEGINRSMRCSYHMTPEAFDSLKTYHYPGNVRELRNILFIAATHSHNREINGALIEKVIHNLHRCEERPVGDMTGGEKFYVPPVDKPVSTEQMIPGETPTSMKAVEGRHIKALLDRFEGNRKKVALALGVSERTIYRKLRNLGLN